MFLDYAFGTALRIVCGSVGYENTAVAARCDAACGCEELENCRV
jgi:hypothetical protein